MMPACSSYKPYRNDSLRAGGMMILELFRNKLLSDISSSLMFQYL